MKLLVNRAMKRVLALFLTVVAVLGLFGMQTPISKVSAAGEGVYTLVTDVADLAAGDQVVIACSSKNVVMGDISTTSTTSTKYGLSVASEEMFSSDKSEITALPDGAKVLTITGDSSGYGFKRVDDNKYLTWSSGNSLTVGANEYLWNISIDNNNAAITSVNTPKRIMRYNASSPRFACYESGQTDIQLYKLDASACSHKGEGEITTAPTCTTDGEKTFICEICGESCTEIIKATGHSYDEGKITTPATCTTEGVKTFKCTKEGCGETKPEAVEKLEHKYVDGVCSVCGEKEPQEITYKLVTDIADLMVGDTIILVGEHDTKGTVAMSATQGNNNRAAVKVSKTDKEIALMEDDATVEKITVEAGSVAGTFAFKTDEGYLYAVSSSSNHMKSQDTIDKDASWKIEIATGGVATVKAQGDNTRNWMRFNNSSNLFSCYSSTSSQQDIYIYRMQYSAEVEAIRAFKNLQTQSTFKLNYNGNTLDESKVQLRFFASMDDALYTELTALNAKFGVEATMNGQTISGYCTNVAQADGEVKFAGLVTIAKSVWDQTVTAKAFVEIDGTKYYMQATDEHSVNSLAAYWLATDDYKDNAVIQYLAGQAE